jgi:hypothetical protein
LPALERRYHRLKKDIVLLELEKQKSEQIGSQVRILAKMSEDYNQQIEELYKKRVGLEGLVKEFENKNEVYKKIRQTTEKEVNNTLSKSKDILRLAISSVIESIVRDPTRYNFLTNSNIYNNGSQKVTQPYIEGYRALILDEAQKIFEILTRDLTNQIMENTIAKIPLQP